jgi:hypothetical protein
MGSVSKGRSVEVHSDTRRYRLRLSPAEPLAGLFPEPAHARAAAGPPPPSQGRSAVEQHPPELVNLGLGVHAVNLRRCPDSRSEAALSSLR